MKKYQFKCLKCDQLWYTTDADSKQTNLERCPHCGSRQITVAEEEYSNYSVKPFASISFGTRFLITLSIVFMPYLGFFLVWMKKPFSEKTNRGAMVYCAIISVIVFAIMAQKLSGKELAFTNNSLMRNSTVSETIVSEESKMESDSDNTIIEGFYKTQIEEQFEEGLVFSALDYLQTDAIGCGLWTCTNTFTGKMTEKEHIYTVRIGHNELFNDGQAIILFVAIDGETIYWDEETEDGFFDAVGE